MKIIRKGPAVSKPWSHRATCTDCETVVELRTYDVGRRWQAADRPWESAGYFYFWTCPLCKNMNYIWDEAKDTLLLSRPEFGE